MPSEVYSENIVMSGRCAHEHSNHVTNCVPGNVIQVSITILYCHTITQSLRLNLGENIDATLASVSPEMVDLSRQHLIRWRIRRASETSYGSGDVDGGINTTFF